MHPHRDIWLPGRPPWRWWSVDSMRESWGKSLTPSWWSSTHYASAWSPWYPCQGYEATWSSVPRVFAFSIRICNVNGIPISRCDASKQEAGRESRRKRGLLVHHPEYLGVAADYHHAGYQEAHDEEKRLGGTAVTVLNDGTGFQVGIVIEFA